MLAQAVTECAANTVKHAEGDRLTVSMQVEDADFTVTLRNNGRPPASPMTRSPKSSTSPSTP